MAQIVAIKGLDEMVSNMKAAADNIRASLEKGMDKATTFFIGQLPDEASIPEPEGSAYTRTGTMMRSVGQEVRTLGVDVVGVVFVGAIAPYAPWVISSEVGNNGAGPQARIHQGRWFTLQGELKKNMDAIRNIILDAVTALAKGGR